MRKLLILIPGALLILGLAGSHLVHASSPPPPALTSQAAGTGANVQSGDQSTTGTDTEASAPENGVEAAAPESAVVDADATAPCTGAGTASESGNCDTQSQSQSGPDSPGGN